jgi:hypothetical protein
LYNGLPQFLGHHYDFAMELFLGARRDTHHKAFLILSSPLHGHNNTTYMRTRVHYCISAYHYPTTLLLAAIGGLKENNCGELL